MPEPIKNTKILLIEPPFYRLFKETYALVRFPLSLGYLAAALLTHTNWEVKVYNSDFHLPVEPFQVSHFTGQGFREYREKMTNLHSGVWEEIRSVIIGHAPAVVGISVKSPTFASARNTARIIKSIAPDTIVIAGGPHVSTDVRSTLDCPDIDIGVLGEGEETIVELASALEYGIDLDSVKGIAFRKGETIRATMPREPIRNLDDIASPHPFAPQVLEEFDSYPPAALGRVIATRGCPHDCLFCGSRAIWGRRVRFRSPDNVCDELRFLQKNGVNIVHFEDDTFGVNSKYLRDLTAMIAAMVPGLRWSCETHVRMITDKNLSCMKAAGCRTIQIGIESGNDRVLKSIRKGFTIDRALKACDRIKQHGLRLETFFMAGFPDETAETLRDTLAVIEKAPADKIVFSLFTPYPGTEAFTLCHSLGLIGSDYDPSLHHHQSPLNCFCSALDLERFRELTMEIERAVVEKNNRSRKNP